MNPGSLILAVYFKNLSAYFQKTCYNISCSMNYSSILLKIAKITFIVFFSCWTNSVKMLFLYISALTTKLKKTSPIILLIETVIQILIYWDLRTICRLSVIQNPIFCKLMCSEDETSSYHIIRKNVEFSHYSLNC